jgi:hypothetical protein
MVSVIKYMILTGIQWLIPSLKSRGLAPIIRGVSKNTLMGVLAQDWSRPEESRLLSMLFQAVLPPIVSCHSVEWMALVLRSAPAPSTPPLGTTPWIRRKYHGKHSAGHRQWAYHQGQLCSGLH